MKLAIEIARLAAWVAATGLLCVLTWLAVAMRTVPARVDVALVRLDGVLLRAEGVESKVYASAVNLDRATGAWSEAAAKQAASVDRLMQTARGTLLESAAAVQEFEATAGTAQQQMQHVGPLLDAARDAVDGVSAQAQPVLANAARTEADVDALVTSRDLTAMLGDGRATMASVRETSANVAAGSAEATVILRDARKEADALLAPKPWYRRVWGDTLKVGELVWDFSR